MFTLKKSLEFDNFDAGTEGITFDSLCLKWAKFCPLLDGTVCFILFSS